MSIYTACKSGLIQRGEDLFYFNVLQCNIDWDKVLQSMTKIPIGGERLMGEDEVLELYD